jgi:AcrR family transcriptional regulator
MAEPVKPRRAYDASGRQAQAAANRRSVIAAASALFLEQGYGRTTIAAIAAEAGVSAETVYATFGSKAELLHRVWDVTIGGDDEDVVFHERAEVQALMVEPDLRVRLLRHAELSARTAQRIAPFLLMVQSAAGAEPAAGAMLEEMGRQRMVGMGFMAKMAAATGQLAVSEEECRDVVWSMTDGLLWHRLVHERGWSQERFATWLGRLWVSLLVDGGA